MMAWRASFNQGISSFRAARYEDALRHLIETVDEGGDQQYTVFDSRAAVYEKLGKVKEALRDAKKVIELAPDRWQGYARAAKLFLSVQKLDASFTMANMALDRVKAGDTYRHVELSKLKEDIQKAKKVLEESQQTIFEDARRNIVVGSRQSPHYHFGKLPVELLGEIFSLIVDENPDKLLVLLRVCQHWRNTIWHTPSLWGTLILTHRNPGQKSTQWVDRSKGYIRELHIKAYAIEHRHWPCDAFTRIKWDRLRVCRLESWDIARYLEGMSLGHILNHLTTLTVNDDKVQPRPPRASLFVEGSRIRSLTMAHAVFPWNSLTTCLSQLIYLDIRDCNATGELVPVLAANPNLETLIIHTQSFPPPLLDTLVELPNLMHLDLAGAGAPNVTKCLTLPNLQKLHLRRGPLALDTVLHNIRPTGLLELTISQSVISPPRLIDFLRKATSLKSLEISQLSNTTNKVVEALATPLTPSEGVANVDKSNSTADVSLMCPSLTHLNVSSSPDVQTGPLVRLIRSRLPRHGPDNADLVPSTLYQELLSLQADGCDLIDSTWIPWFRSNLQTFSCVYMTKKGASWKR